MNTVFVRSGYLMSLHMAIDLLISTIPYILLYESPLTTFSVAMSFTTWQ